MGGLMSITGLPGQGPVGVGIPIADPTAGMFLALGKSSPARMSELFGWKRRRLCGFDPRQKRVG